MRWEEWGVSLSIRLILGVLHYLAETDQELGCVCRSASAGSCTYC